MKKKVISIDPRMSVINSARLMSKFGISSLLVISNGEIHGIVTEKDIINRVVCLGLNPRKVFVYDIMTYPIIFVQPNESVENAVKLMNSNKIRKLPVVSKKDDKYNLVGIITLFDVARFHPELVNTIISLNATPTDSVPNTFIC
jgi:CBS domain-containing protein